MYPVLIPFNEVKKLYGMMSLFYRRLEVLEKTADEITKQTGNQVGCKWVEVMYDHLKFYCSQKIKICFHGEFGMLRVF